MTAYNKLPRTVTFSSANQEISQRAKEEKERYKQFLHIVEAKRREAIELIGKNDNCTQAAVCYNQFVMSSTTPIDISNIPDLVRLTKEVEATQTPLELKRENKIVAVLTPVKTAGKQQNKKAIEETLALAGAWKDIPSDDMEERLDTIRHESKLMPPFTLDDA